MYAMMTLQTLQIALSITSKPVQAMKNIIHGCAKAHCSILTPPECYRLIVFLAGSATCPQFSGLFWQAFLHLLRWGQSKQQ